MTTVMILTREINAYDQDGEYFVAVYDGIPSHSQLRIDCPDLDHKHYAHLRKGGGRVKDEDTWYHLREYKVRPTRSPLEK